MMRRRFRRRSKSHPHDPSREHSRIPRSPFNLLWAIFGVIVLVSVIFYDQSQIAEAKQHIEQAQNFQQHGLYAEALKEYQRAYTNKRLGRHQKGDVALAIGDIYYDQFENYDMAHSYYVRAKQDNPKLMQSGTAQERLKAAAQKSAGSGATNNSMAGDETTSTVIQRVQLLSVPQQDERGPVVARYKGGVIHAGEFLRYLKARPEFLDTHFREDPRRLEDLLKQYVTVALRYQAGEDAGVQRDPDISTRLYDYQRTLVAERYLAQEKLKSRSITPRQVQDYYEQHKGDYVQPAAAEIAMIKTGTDSEAQKALEQVRAGSAFGDVATSVSSDEKSAKQHGLVGRITDKDSAIPGGGQAPELVKELLGLRTGSVTGVAPVNGSFYIFQVIRSVPGRTTTLDEARADIEMKLQGKMGDAAATGAVDEALRDRYDPEVALDGMQKFWQFAVGENPRSSDAGTSEAQTTSRTAESTAGAVQRSR